MILSDEQIHALCTKWAHQNDPGVAPGWREPRGPMIDPFVAKLEESGVVSYGLTSFGYDMRAAPEWCLFTDVHSALIDPKEPSEKYFVRTLADEVVIPPNGYALTRSVEYVRMPDNVMGVCVGKSTYARVGLHVNMTPLEPGWEGHVTIELSNATRCPVKVYANEGIMQVLFFAGSAPINTYRSRKGKYQGQTGVTLAKVSAKLDVDMGPGWNGNTPNGPHDP